MYVIHVFASSFFLKVSTSPRSDDRVFQKLISEKYAHDDFETKTMYINNPAHLDRAVFVIMILLGLGMLIGPLWWLNNLADHGANLAPRLGIITGFLVLFVALISVLTIAKAFEVLAATAAYGAVLMVFMQLGRPSSGP